MKCATLEKKDQDVPKSQTLYLKGWRDHWQAGRKQSRRPEGEGKSGRPFLLVTHCVALTRLFMPLVLLFPNQEKEDGKSLHTDAVASGT